MNQVAKERRKHPRQLLDRPIKICLAEGGHYLAGRTKDVSPFGALVELDHPNLLPLGREVKVAVAWNNQAMVSTGSMIAAQIVRNLGHGGRQVVALRFEQPQSLRLNSDESADHFRAA